MKAQPYSDQKNWSNTYLTDPALIRALGPFVLDPCCPPVMPWETAKVMFYEDRYDGLKENWQRGQRRSDRVFMNPPYRGVMRWARRFLEYGHGIALLNGRSVETKATQLLMANSSAVFFPDQRLVFYKPDGTPWDGKWFPSVLIGLDKTDALKLRALPLNNFNGVFLIGPKGER